MFRKKVPLPSTYGLPSLGFTQIMRPSMECLCKSKYPNSVTKKDIVTVQFEYHLLNKLCEGRTLEYWTEQQVQYSRDGQRSKQVITMEFTWFQYYYCLIVPNHKKAFHTVLEKKLFYPQKVMLEVDPKTNHRELEQNEYHELREQINRVGHKYLWVFVFNNNIEEVGKSVNLHLLYSETFFVPRR